MKIDGHVQLEENYNEYKKLSDKQSIEETLVQRAVITTIQILYDKGFFDNYANIDEILKEFFSQLDENLIQKK